MDIEESKILLKDFQKGKIEKDKLEHYRGSYKMGYFYTVDIQEALETVLSELEKKEAIINEMSNFINLMGNELVAETGDNNLEFCKRQKCIDNEELDCEECIKEYFTNKVEREGK